jgi:protein-disulfide isomerase
MEKNIIVAGAFVGIVIVVVILFTSFQDGWVNNPGGMAMKTAPTINLENGSPVLGSESAPITVIEFGDYQCESCYYWFHNTRSTLIDNYNIISI